MLDLERDSAPFDGVAGTYDRNFTHTALGRELRERVWQRLEAHFSPGTRVLELNCGTGEDAVWLAERGVRVVATDQSDAMLEVARRKIERTASASVELTRLDLEQPEAIFTNSSFDGAFSNFGGLNCVGDVRVLARSLARWLKPGATLVLVVMGPLCLWETLYYLARFEPRTAFRRGKKRRVEARVGGRSLRVSYPWPSELARRFEPEFRLLRWWGLGVALPPTILVDAMEKHPRALRFLQGLEDRISKVRPFSYFGDHFILELERHV